MIIYKITNLINNKVYIGLTTKSLTYRWGRHLTEGKNLKNQKPLYRAIRKYGESNFQVEEIDSAPNIKTLGELERYYIKYFNSKDPKFGYNLTSGGEHNQWDANPSSKLSYEEVVQIRKIYASQESTLAECYKTFSNKISQSGLRRFGKGSPGLEYLAKFTLLKEKYSIARLKLKPERLMETLFIQTKKC